MTLFLLTVFGLLLGAGIKGKMEKAGLEARFNWTAGRELWEVCSPMRSTRSLLRLMLSPFFRLHRDSYRADVQKSLGLGYETFLDVEMVVGGTSTPLCQTRLRADRYTYYILHNDLREDIKST